MPKPKLSTQDELALQGRPQRRITEILDDQFLQEQVALYKKRKQEEVKTQTEKGGKTAVSAKSG